MTMMEIPANLGHGGAHLNRSVLRELLVEHRAKLESIEGQITALNASPRPDYIRSTVVQGAAANTDIAVPGASARDVILGVVKLDFTLTEGEPNTRTWDVEDLRSEAFVSSGGTIRLRTTDTTGAVLVVTWLNA